ncbi:microtubule-associated rp eb family [Plasmopara halstedii]|uniref:Microtubule-associated rp eb family n=1 Tax=Plasmopara halstedii TaxID=4781 RepID=A0A0P1B0V6_PLAHL|nr:microtubule-associated rp eb family [Plasmopara halstedii]CEG48310.1 microtubule-associated rp eb family [Plasmopara halstedii]|eukprot:XP_024584679.1 microtubule-associated rp eb family [Plasmopara halstedii]
MSLRKLKWRGIGRLELLAWLNEFLQTDYTKIEHLADGIAYCQIFNTIYPGKVNLKRLNLHARTETENERNLKVLRCAFHLCDVRKEIPIPKLARDRSFHGLRRKEDIHLSNIDMQSSMSHQDGTFALQQEDAGAIEKLVVDNGVPKCGDDDGDPNGQMHEFIDPALQFVKHSFCSTLKAKAALTSLEECLNDVGSVHSQSAFKQGLSQNPKLRPNRGRKTNNNCVHQLEEMNEPDPMTCRRISEVIECLESELFGRIKDLQCLEKTIEELMKQ